MFPRSETSNVSPRIDFQRDLERDKQLPFPDDQSSRFKALSLFLAELKTFIVSVCIFVRRHATKNKTFDLGFKSPCDACLGLQMAQKQHRVGLLKCKLFFFQNSANLCEAQAIIFQEGNSPRLVIISSQNAILTPGGLPRAWTPPCTLPVVIVVDSYHL